MRTTRRFSCSACFARHLQRAEVARQRDRREQRHDGQHDQQLDQREAPAPPALRRRAIGTLTIAVGDAVQADAGRDSEYTSNTSSPSRGSSGGDA